MPVAPVIVAVKLASPRAGAVTLAALNATVALDVKNDGVMVPPVDSAFTNDRL